MPFYEYQCRACGKTTEVLQKISDAPLRKCPSCGKNQLAKLVSAPVFRLKGGGWYETDFKGDSDRKRNLAGADKDEPAPKAADAAPGDTKADAKPEAKPADKPAAKPVETSASKSAAKSSGKASPRKTAKAAAKPGRGAKARH
jgi:putative FmdB family regulatory protein